jgi:anti-sigma regulatory factor (Ser/Thr protein kinase)
MNSQGSGSPPTGEGPRARTLPVRGRSDVVVAGSQARRLARDLGFSARRAAEIAIVVAELASNIVKHGVRGELTFAFDAEAAPRGELAITARDAGPPIRDFQQALRDGHDDQGPIDPALLLRRGGLGTGLGAIARLADRLDYRPEQEGKSITARFSR